MLNSSEKTERRKYIKINVDKEGKTLIIPNVLIIAKNKVTY